MPCACVCQSSTARLWPSARQAKRQRSPRRRKISRAPRAQLRAFRASSPPDARKSGSSPGATTNTKSRQDDLTELEKTFREATQKRARLEASERARTPAAKLIEAASTPREPWSPPYWRDTAIAAGGSLPLALLAMWLVELFNRIEPQPAVVLVRPQMGGVSYDARIDALPRQGSPLLDRTEPPLLAAQPRLPRELEREEVAALLQASDEPTCLVVLLLLGGLTPEEAITARAGDVDLDRGLDPASAVQPSGRSTLAMRCARNSRRGRQSNRRILWSVESHRSATRESIDAQILCASHHAALQDPADVNAACLRHTYAAYLVRQGIRFADLTSLVGELPPQLLGAYTSYASLGPRVPRGQIETKLSGRSRERRELSQADWPGSHAGACLILSPPRTWPVR